MTEQNPVLTDQVAADPKKPWKAWIGSLFAFLGLLWASLEGRDTLSNMSVMEWLAIIVPTILTWGAIYITPNPKVLKVGRRLR